MPVPLSKLVDGTNTVQISTSDPGGVDTANYDLILVGAGGLPSSPSSQAPTPVATNSATPTVASTPSSTPTIAPTTTATATPSATSTPNPVVQQPGVANGTPPPGGANNLGLATVGPV